MARRPRRRNWCGRSVWWWRGCNGWGGARATYKGAVRANPARWRWPGNYVRRRRCRWRGLRNGCTWAAEGTWRGCCNRAAEADRPHLVTKPSWEYDNLMGDPCYVKLWLRRIGPRSLPTAREGGMSFCQAGPCAAHSFSPSSSRFFSSCACCISPFSMSRRYWNRARICSSRDLLDKMFVVKRGPSGTIRYCSTAW